MRSSIKSIDLAKLLAAIMIIVLHTSPLQDFTNFGDKALIGLCRIGVPLFFVMSSYLFFLKDGDYGPRLKKYCFRILKYWIVYSVLGIILLKPPFGWNLLRTFLFDGFGVVWFFHGLIVAMCLFVLLLVLNGKGYLKWYVYTIPIMLYVCSLLMNTYYSLIPEGVRSWLERYYYPVFVTARNGFFSGTIYMLIGYCMATTNKPHRIKDAVLRVFVAVLLFFAELFFSWSFTEKIHGRELFLTMPLLIICVMQFILTIEGKCSVVPVWVCFYCRKLSFALYGWQILYIVIIPGTINSLLRFGIITLLSLATGMLLIWLSNSRFVVVKRFAGLFI